MSNLIETQNRGDSEDDLHLVDRSLDGETEAFSALVEKYQRPIYFTALRMLSWHEEAADIAQQTFINAFRALKTFKRKSSFKTWLFQIAMNLCRNRIKERMRTPNFEDVMETDVAGSEKMPQEVLNDLEDSARLRRAIAGLPDQQRATVILRVYEEYSYEQIADTLGCVQETARAHYHYGIRALRKALAETPQIKV